VRSERGYASDCPVYLFDGLAERLAVELAARKEKPQVWCSARQLSVSAIDELQRETVKLVRVLSRHGVTSWLNTRGSIQRMCSTSWRGTATEFVSQLLLRRSTRQFSAPIEPQASSSDERLHLITELKALKIPVEVSLEPLLPNVTDSRDLCSRCSSISPTAT